MANLKNKKILMVIAPEQFRDEELNQPMEIFKKKEAIVIIASTSLGEAKGMFGSKVKVDKLISSVNYNDYDAIVVVGGMGSPTYLWNDTDLKNLIINANKSGKIVGAICLSGIVLARAGILKGIDATVYRTTESLKEYAQNGAKYNPKNLVKSDNIITADGPASARDFGNAIVDTLI